MDVAGRAARLRRRSPTARSTPCSSPSSSTSATSPGSPARPAAAGRRPTASCSSPTAATASRPPSSWPRPASTAASRSRSTGQKEIVAGAVGAAGAARLGPRGRRRHLGRAAHLRRATGSPTSSWCPPRAWSTALRLVKDDGEVARIEAAAAIADAALATVRPRLAEAPTEAEFGLELDTEMRRLGADDVSFETIVASGPNGAKPHHRPGHRTIVDGDLVVLDFGALVDGYRSDMTRTVVVGEPAADPAAHARRGGRGPGRRRGRGGAPASRAKAVDAACRDVIAEAGWGDAFLHGTGHGVGLEIHEDPRVGQTSTATLAAGHVVTVEPGVYLPEHGGVRIEDTVVVTADGCRPHAHPQARRDLTRPRTCTRRNPMAITTNDLKNGMTLDLPRGCYQVVEFQHVKPGKGGAFVRTTLRNVRTGARSTRPSAPARRSSRP